MSDPGPGQIRLGYVGLGNIGGPMAASLTAWSDELTVFDLSADAVAKLVDAGATAASSLVDLATRADIIGICVLNDDQVRTVVSGAGGLLEAATPGTIIAVHSTISPQTATELAAHCADKGVTLLDAPISGGAAGAEQRRLAIMVGGDREAYLRLKEPYAAVSDMLVHAGNDVGAGTKMKLARNLMHFVAFTAAMEASRLAEAAGIDITKLGKVVRHTDAITGGPGAIMLRDTTADVAPDDFWHDVLIPVRGLGEKDLALALELGRELDVDLPLGEIALRDFAAELGVPHQEGEQR